MNKAEFALMLKKESDNKDAEFYSNADNSISIRIQQNSVTAFFVIPCPVGDICSDDNKREMYLKTVREFVRDMRKKMNNIYYESLFCHLG